MLIDPVYFTPRLVGAEDEARQGLYRVPDHQRFPAWQLPKKQKLVDSVLNNYPIHAVILNRHFEVVNGLVSEYFTVEDGQTRMTTLQDYLLGRFCTDDEDDHHPNRFFQDLSLEQRQTFLNYQITLEIFAASTENGIADHVIAEIFTRLNSGKPLGDHDKFHARMDTPVVNYVQNRLKRHPDLIVSLKDVGDGRSRRGLGDLIGVVLAIAFREGTVVSGQSCLTTSYEQNYKHLMTQISEAQHTEIISFFRTFLSTRYPHKTRHFKITGLLGVCASCWVRYGVIRPEIFWYADQCAQDPHYQPETFKTLNKGDLRNSQGLAILRRVDKIIQEYTNVHA